MVRSRSESPRRRAKSSSAGSNLLNENRNSSDLNEAPRSILRKSLDDQQQQQHQSHRIAFRLDGRQRQARRTRLVSFSQLDQVFIIPSRRQLREQHLRALKRRKMRRRLTLRPPRPIRKCSRRQISRSPSYSRNGTRFRSSPRPQRQNRLAKARRRYVRAARRRNRQRRNPVDTNSQEDRANSERGRSTNPTDDSGTANSPRMITIQRRRSRSYGLNRHRRRRRIHSPPLSDENFERD